MIFESNSTNTPNYHQLTAYSAYMQKNGCVTLEEAAYMAGIDTAVYEQKAEAGEAVMFVVNGRKMIPLWIFDADKNINPVAAEIAKTYKAKRPEATAFDFFMMMKKEFLVLSAPHIYAETGNQDTLSHELKPRLYQQFVKRRSPEGFGRNLAYMTTLATGKNKAYVQQALSGLVARILSPNHVDDTLKMVMHHLPQPDAPFPDLEQETVPDAPAKLEDYGCVSLDRAADILGFDANNYRRSAAAGKALLFVGDNDEPMVPLWAFDTDGKPNQVAVNVFNIFKTHLPTELKGIENKPQELALALCQFLDQEVLSLSAAHIYAETGAQEILSHELKGRLYQEEASEPSPEMFARNMMFMVTLATGKNKAYVENAMYGLLSRLLGRNQSYQDTLKMVAENLPLPRKPLPDPVRPHNPSNWGERDGWYVSLDIATYGMQLYRVPDPSKEAATPFAESVLPQYISEGLVGTVVEVPVMPEPGIPGAKWRHYADYETGRMKSELVDERGRRIMPGAGQIKP